MILYSDKIPPIISNQLNMKKGGEGLRYSDFLPTQSLFCPLLKDDLK